MKRSIHAIAICSGLALFGSVASAESTGSESAAVGKTDLIYGGELMSPAEIADYNRRLSGNITPDDREKFMMQHRTAMDERAAERGVKLKESAAKTPDPSKGGGGGGGNLPGGGVGSGGTSGGIGGVGGAGGGGGVGP